MLGCLRIIISERHTGRKYGCRSCCGLLAEYHERQSLDILHYRYHQADMRVVRGVVVVRDIDEARVD